MQMSLPLISLVVFATLIILYRKIKYKVNKNRAPTSPHSSPTEVNMKSVWISGIYPLLEKLLLKKPLPNIPPDPIAVKDCVTWYRESEVEVSEEKSEVILANWYGFSKPQYSIAAHVGIAAIIKPNITFKLKLEIKRIPKPMHKQTMDIPKFGCL